MISNKLLTTCLVTAALMLPASTEPEWPGSAWLPDADLIYPLSLQVSDGSHTWHIYRVGLEPLLTAEAKKSLIAAEADLPQCARTGHRWFPARALAYRGSGDVFVSDVSNCVHSGNSWIQCQNVWYTHVKRCLNTES